MTRPNFLFVMADQMAGPALSMYGHGVVKTPRLEQLAEQGVTFKNAYCNNPICAPSRFSMMAGQLTSRIGAFDNASEFPSAIPTFAHYLRDLDYHTCLSGKMHFVGADQLHGFEDRLTTDIYPSDFGWTPDWSETEEPFAPSVMSMRGVVEAGLCKRSLQIDYDEEVAFAAVRQIYDYARRRDDRPFLLGASFTHPHNPFTITQDYWNRYDDDEIDMPSVPFIPYRDRDPWSQRYYRLIRQDEHDVDDAMILNARHAYYAMISYVDDKVGMLLDALDDAGLADNTVVIFTADHGDMMGERGMWYKFNPFEWSVRVPFIVRAPGSARGRVENKGVSLLDLLPSLLDLATGGHPPELVDPIDGHSLVNLLHGPDDSWRDDVMIEFTGEGTYSPCLILRRDGFKYVYCEDDPGMLFDLVSDPGELHNLCGHPAHASTEQRMLAEIHARWNAGAIKARVIESQRRRRFVQNVLLKGRRHPWDYQPYRDASRAFVRSSKDTNTTMTKGLARFPYMEPVPPDTPRSP
ncbi:MAG: choline-sulfatase [Gammaproteobacteria bacterium]